MPIRFRCGYCNRLLGIARRKAGTETTCPHCGYTLTVPEEPAGDIAEMEDLDALLNPESASTPAPAAPASSARTQTKVPATHSTPSPVSQPLTPKAWPAAASPRAAEPRPATTDRPVFERAVENVLVVDKPAAPETARADHPPAAARDASNLAGERSEIVLSVQKATLLAILMVVLIGISFAAGFLLASSK